MGETLKGRDAEPVPQVQIGPGSERTPERRDTWLGSLVIAFTLAVALANFPRTVLSPEIDPSFAGVLSYAHQHRLQFGQDIVFTYGPLGYLFVEDTSGYAMGLGLAGRFVLAWLVSAGACLLAWRMAAGWRWLFLGFLVLSPANSARAADLLFPVGLLCWGLLCLTERDQRRALIWEFVLALLVGVLSLIKFTFLMEGGLTLAAVVADRIARGERRPVPRLLGASAGTFVIGWLALGQHVSGLWGYATNSWRIAQGYDLAMGAAAMRELRVGGVAVVVLTILALSTRARAARDGDGLLPGRRRVILGLWLFLVAAVSWKHGYVRGDHLGIFLGFAAVLNLALEGVGCASARIGRLTRGLGITAAVLACTTLEWSTPRVMEHRFDRTFERFSNNLRALVRPSSYKEQMADLLEQERQREQLPAIRKAVGNATVDVFGDSQSYALYNDLRYTPRPVFQSYCAYSSSLARLNEQFYEGPSAPDFVLFNLSPIDGRFPSLEDARVLATVLSRYQLVESEGIFLLLKRVRASGPALRLVSEGTAVAGQPIPLPDSGAAELWMELTLKSSWLGRLQEFFYQPPQVKLAWHREPRAEEVEEFRAPAPMLAAGFLVSPLLRDNADVAALYAGNTNTRPAAVSVRVGANLMMFHMPLQYRIYRFQAPLVPVHDAS